MKNLETEIVALVANALEKEASLFTLETGIGDFVEWNSFAHLVIITSIEERFGITFDPLTIMDIEDVGDLVEAVRLKGLK